MHKSEPPSIAVRLRQRRQEAGLTLEELASRAGISKTYLWELEKDEAGVKRPSAVIVLRLATALSTTISDLLGRPSLAFDNAEVELTPSLVEFRDRMSQLGTPLTELELGELAKIQFRGGQPTTADQWQQLYLVLAISSRRTRR